MARNTYTTMDRVGFINTNSTMAERILADYLGTNASQSNTFKNQLVSLIATVKNNPNNPIAVANQVQTELNGLFNSYMDNAVVEATAKQMNTTTNLYEIEIYIQYTEGGVVQQVAKTLQYDNKGISRLITLENR